MTIQHGHRIPAVDFGSVEAGELRVRSSHEVFGRRRVLVIGAPAAFSPICSRVHLPKFIDLAPSLLSSGFDALICLASSNPWSMAEWAKQLDPYGRVTFMSDGNLEFGRACGLIGSNKDLFLGTCLERFSMIVANLLVEKVAVERSMLEVTCSSAEMAAGCAI